MEMKFSKLPSDLNLLESIMVIYNIQNNVFAKTKIKRDNTNRKLCSETCSTKIIEQSIYCGSRKN